MTLRQALLQSIEELEPEAYGPPINHRTSELLGRRRFPLSYGAMYTELDRMEAEGLVESWLAPRPTGGRQARFYRLTQDGSRERARLEIEERVPVALRAQRATG